jgi:hypothetical protein
VRVVGANPTKKHSSAPAHYIYEQLLLFIRKYSVFLYKLTTQVGLAKYVFGRQGTRSFTPLYSLMQALTYSNSPEQIYSSKY